MNQPMKASPYLEANDFGVWEIRWSTKGRNKRLSTGERELRRACAVFVEWIRTYWRTGQTKRLATGNLIDEYSREHVDGHVVDKERQRLILQHLKKHFGEKSPGEVTPAAVAQYQEKRMAGLIGRRASSGTINLELTALTSVFSHAVRNKRMKLDDVPHIPKPPKSSPRSRFLDQWEAVALLAACDAGQTRGGRTIHTRSGLFARIALETGGRPEAILELQWSQVDLVRGLINFAKPGDQETTKRRSIVPISETLAHILTTERDNIRRTEFVLGIPGEIKKSFSNALRRVGLPGHVHPKTLRRTWATWASMRGVPMTDIARVLGDTVTITERHYAHYSPEYLRGAVERHGGGANGAVHSVRSNKNDNSLNEHALSA